MPHNLRLDEEEYEVVLWALYEYANNMDEDSDSAKIAMRLYDYMDLAQYAE